MFIFRFIKNIIFWAGLLAALYFASAHVEIHGKPARQYADEFFKSDLWHEGVKDMKTWASAIFKAAGEKVEESITPEDQQELNNVIESDLKLQLKQIKTDTETSGKK